MKRRFRILKKWQKAKKSSQSTSLRWSSRLSAETLTRSSILQTWIRKFKEISKRRNWQKLFPTSNLARRSMISMHRNLCLKRTYKAKETAKMQPVTSLKRWTYNRMLWTRRKLPYLSSKMFRKGSQTWSQKTRCSLSTQLRMRSRQPLRKILTKTPKRKLTSNHRVVYRPHRNNRFDI